MLPRTTITRVAAWAALTLLFGLSSARADEGRRHAGHPTVVLDKLEIPNVPGAAGYKRHLKQVLRREARRADWGVGRGHRIEYRFVIEKLAITRHGSVLRVKCTAIGRLPKGKTAKSQLAYGGDPNRVHATVRNVLEIVARGVMTRLAELERVRRGQLSHSGVRPLPPAE
jgi:hypothetical protein